MQNILIADEFDSRILEQLKSDGHTVQYEPSLTTNHLITASSKFNILVVRSTKITREVLSSSRNLSLIIRAGVGVDTIDLKSATEQGILVSNTPGCNSDAVAELAIGHIIACDRQIVNNAESLRNGKWVKKQYLNCGGLFGRTLGVVGAGAIAQRVIRVAQAMGMRVICCAPELDQAMAERLDVQRAADKFEIARKSDVISMHIPLFKQTFHYCSTEFFDAMKEGAIFVNTSRGEIVDTEALITAIKRKGIRAGLDVYENEPTGGSGPFQATELAKLLSSCTCHIGGSTTQASEAVGVETLKIIKKFVGTGEALNCVNPEAKMVPQKKVGKQADVVKLEIGKIDQVDVKWLSYV
jgi:D-3-phosphoglycerate dehydrogenase